MIAVSDRQFLNTWLENDKLFPFLAAGGVPGGEPIHTQHTGYESSAHDPRHAPKPHGPLRALHQQ